MGIQVIDDQVLPVVNRCVAEATLLFDILFDAHREHITARTV